ncbi:MAG: hypothetical protein JO279_17615 [Verrucomicrobia bacterium]|nr:hypothetical protein [Verrucomicrobiota bacterium]
MSRFLKVFLRDPLSAKVQVAGFGKHPAWDDHIDDIGLSTETLVLTKQLLYSEGIATQLASGAWDQIEKSGNAIQFDHRFVWSRNEQSILGAIWDSADRKGRTRFPLVICAHAGFTGLRAIDLLFESIERLGSVCRTVNTQKEVHDAFVRAQWELNGANLLSSDDSPWPEIADSAENSMLPALVTFSAGLKERRPREVGQTGRSHFRLDAISSQAKINLRFWSAYLASRRTAPNPPYLVIASNGKGWIDVIVGEPMRNDFFCLRANNNALAATWIEIEGPQRQKLESEAKDYLQTCRFSPGSLLARRRSWWSNLFNPKKPR